MCKIANVMGCTLYIGPGTTNGASVFCASSNHGHWTNNCLVAVWGASSTKPFLSYTLVISFLEEGLLDAPGPTLSY